MPGRVGRVDGGQFGDSFAIQSDGVGAVNKMRKLLTRCGQCTGGWGFGVGGDSDDLKLSSQQGGDRATVLAACLTKAQGPKQ